ncbi:MAG: DUF5698 domain-containing protein [Clostridium sp.]|nr:DUF5698 domain-containing protein [Clostridium sp.]MCM1444223.1 DUF5698 domain-containing protein [Candidatus Amulumruptor caecigallinarius]
MELLFLCLKVFFARIIDVSLGTIRTIMIAKNKKLYATIFAFCEVFVWFLVVREALNTDIKSIFIAISYAGGYATGTFVGSTIADKFIKGLVSMQVITSKKNDKMVEIIRNKGYAVSVIDAKGKNNVGKYMLYIEIEKSNLEDLKALVKELDEKAFVVVSDTKFVENGFIK